MKQAAKQWPNVRFGDIVVHSAFGPRFSSNDYADDGNIATLRTTDLDNHGRISYDTMPLARLNENHFASHILSPGDLLITRSGTCGIAAVFEGFTLPVLAGAFLIRFCLGDTANPKFFRYYFNSPFGRRHILSVARGAVQQNLNITSIEALTVPLPCREEQERIVATVSAYDDLIENNRRRTALLEESARLLYQEWFVRLRFPGHERTRISDGVPEGWARTTLGELCHIRRGASPRPIQAFMDGTVPWFKIGDATGSSSMYIFRTAEHVTEEGAKKSVLLGPGELIISNSATCGLPYFTGVTGCIHDGWLLLQPSSFVSREMLYLCLNTKRAELVNSVSDGSTQKNLNTDAAGRLPLVLPSSDSLTREFDAIVKPIFTQINTLARCSDSARAARDLLLPRLMNGEIAV